MITQSMGAIVIALLLFTPCTAVAQTGPVEVTFKVPLNLTELSADITQIRVECMVGSPEQQGQFRLAMKMFSNSQEMPVSGNQVVATAEITVSVDRGAVTVGETWDYGCNLFAFSNALQQWHDFADGQQLGIAAYQLKPVPSTINGSIVW